MQSLSNKTHIKQPSFLKRKRLGQFFTGSSLARLLAALSNVNQVKNAIDPMVGTGDMLQAVKEINSNTNLWGIEIDNQIIKQASVSLNSYRPNLFQGNAFSYNTWPIKYRKNFDLVITNPPYVRYQNFVDEEIDNNIPSASQIRQDLLSCINLLEDKEDQQIFKEIIQSYSGLSDLAVPSLVLCSMLTKVGGTLAVVIPESWLSRDYAQIIHYILLRWFKIKYIVEDTNASWFPDAMVKTTLLVADRIPRRSSAFSWVKEIYTHIKISSDAATAKSIIGNIYSFVLSPEKKFAHELEQLLIKGEEKESQLWSSKLFKLSEVAENLKTSANGSQWIKKIEDISYDSTSQISIPVQLRKWLVDSKAEFRSLDELGVLVGQGLRTGANPFFYVDLIESNKNESLIKASKIIRDEILSVPADYLQPVLRRQAELHEEYDLKKSNIKGRVLIIPGTRKITGGLAKLIRKAEKTQIGGKFIPELSSVKTNIKENNSWYVLPKLAPRHKPKLFIPRVISNTPRSYLNSSNLVIDANFSSLWLKPNSKLTPTALLALMNSSWAIANMELSGAVMGGGALKLEAVHLKRIPFPIMNEIDTLKLDKLGKELVQTASPDVLNRIDKTILEKIFKQKLSTAKLEQLISIIQQRQNERSKR